ncbi:MAG TPA: protein kinase, partial [Verrucomicrobiae bacterium]
NLDLAALCRDAATTVMKVARAVHYAHQRGILHRDLKPTNILLDGRGEPQLTDFGLAKLIERDAALTQSVTVMGTANYMSPEQARGITKEVTTATDIYSLGAILFELLTGRPPFVAETFVSTLRKVVEEEPPAPHTMRPGLDRDLETICLKCLEKDPRARYGSAELLANDLERWLRHEPIQARPSTIVERVAKAARRRPIVAALSAAMLVLFFAGVGGVLWQWQRANANARESKGRLVHSFIANGVKRMDEGDLFGSLPWLLEAYRLEQNSPAHAELHRLRLAATLRQCPKLVHVFFHDGPLNEAQFSPDGKLIASATSGGTVRVFKADTGEMSFPPIKIHRQVRTIQFSPDSSKLLTLTGEAGISAWDFGIAEIWDTLTGQLLGRFGPEGESVESAQFSPDGTKLAVGSGEARAFSPGAVTIWDIGSRRQIETKPMKHRNRIPTVQFTRDGSRLLTAGFDGVARIWDAQTGEALSPPFRHNQGLVGASFDSTGTLVVAATHGGYAQMWKTNGDAFGPPLDQARVIYDARFSPDDTRVLTMGYDGTARVWNAGTGAQICPPLRHELLVWRAAFSADATRVATASFDNTARVWDATTGEPLTPPLNHAGFVMTATFSPDGYYLLTSSRDRTVRLWA